MQFLSQRNPIWADVKIGQSPINLGRYGCTITCLSMATDYFTKGKGWIAPDSIAIKQKFTKDGLILWSQLNFACMSFLKRGYGRNDIEIIEAINNPDKVVILQVENYHWVLALGKSLLGGYRIADPWIGKESTTRSYKDQVTGYAIFTRK